MSIKCDKLILKPNILNYFPLQKSVLTYGVFTLYIGTTHEAKTSYHWLFSQSRRGEY